MVFPGPAMYNTVRLKLRRCIYHAVNVISTTKAPGAVGPYSQAIKAGDFLFASGQIAINPEKGKIVSGGVVEQAEQCMKNVGAILEEAGLSYDDVSRRRFT